MYSAIVSAIIYPIFGSWAWGSLFNGSGWLEGFGFIDFAGSTVVHSVGGWAALAGALLRYPHQSVLTVARIHLQALRLWIKGAPFHRKPEMPCFLFS